MKISELRQRRSELAGNLANLIDKPDEFAKVRKELTDTDGLIERAQIAQDAARGAARAVGDAAGQAANEPISPNQLLRFDSSVSRSVRAATWGYSDYVAHSRACTGFQINPQQHFRGLGEQLVAVARHYMGDANDARLVRAPIPMENDRFSRAPAGAGESDATAGGFLVQTDFASAIWTRAYDMGDILGRVFKLPISANANGIKLPAVDETSRATGSRWGGVQSYWLAEGNQPTPTKPKFRMIELDLKKLFSTMYVTDELLQDQTALETIAMQAFSEEIMFMTEDAIFEGDGVGKPMGILNAPCLVQVAKDNGQAAASLSLNNIVSMWSRMWIRSRKNAVWYINQDVEPQLYQLAQTVGTGGLPMFLPAGGLNNAPYSSLFGRPVIPIEYAATLGTPGDLALADFSQYVLADKRGMQAATSIHVRFLTDEMVFRFTYRVDGEPLWHTSLQPFKGSNTKSPFVVLAQR
jgi:HK97 family phage major capsid protein